MGTWCVRECAVCRCLRVCACFLCARVWAGGCPCSFVCLGVLPSCASSLRSQHHGLQRCATCCNAAPQAATVLILCSWTSKCNPSPLASAPLAPLISVPPERARPAKAPCPVQEIHSDWCAPHIHPPAHARCGWGTGVLALDYCAISFPSNCGPIYALIGRCEWGEWDPWTRPRS